jgi:hypothetical protein
MQTFPNNRDLSRFLPALLVLLHNVVENWVQSEDTGDNATDVQHRLLSVNLVHSTLLDLNSILSSVLHDFRLSHSSSLMDPELGWWVKPRNLAWFSQFLLFEYDDARWIQCFRMSKTAVFRLAALLRPQCEKQNTKYRKAIPIAVRVACALFKLTQGASLLICSEFFAVGKSTVCKVVREFVRAVNCEFRHELRFPRGHAMIPYMADFKQLCGLPAVVGAIDGTHFHIKKSLLSPEDYFYFKTNGYTVACQAVVDNKKKFVDIFVGMPGSTNDARMLRRSSLYREAREGNLFDVEYSQDNFASYLIGDKGYPLLPWLQVPFRDLPVGRRSVVERLFNRKLSQGRAVVENAFGILKQAFRELKNYSELHVTLVPDVVLCCALLHNILLGQSPGEVERLLECLQREGMVPTVDDDRDAEDAAARQPFPEFDRGEDKRRELNTYLAFQQDIHD